ncbi:hypothetical protein FRZ67_13120 [Panacibacter ginsenosidivorans]|uniref:Uncharacterized protein n=1 Tax=Panacibacter ginsenosidivorans TaxID=1813871 RepID=A0A5B8VBY8_9BACT|nr:hypothetical protein [Panacibacter ginsenosidivorans]QEC68196.1 hypothetical protein FRZ67_13120 [Panacibacter ginsenosidivorans]
MNIYHPYEALADTEDCLHLKESENRERYQFIVTRLVPLFLILFTWFFLQQVGASIPMGWNYVLIAVTLFVAVLLFTRSYITELKIVQHKELYIVQKTIFGTKEKNINRSDINNIKLVRKRGMPGSVLFVMNIKPGKSILLLSIPPANKDEHHLRLIKERLEDLLQINITEQK